MSRSPTEGAGSPSAGACSSVGKSSATWRMRSIHRVVRPLTSIARPTIRFDPQATIVQLNTEALKSLNVGFKEISAIVPLSKDDRIEDAIKKVAKKFDLLRKDRDGWKERAIVAEGKLKKMGHRMVHNRAALESLTLGEALKAWKAKLVGDPDYVNDQSSTAKMLVDKFDEHTKAFRHVRA